MASTILNTIYTVAALIVAVVGVAAVMWGTPSLPSARGGKTSGTLITIAVAVFTIATAALLLA